MDIHQHIFLKSSAIGDSQLWFSDYINHSPPASWAQITIHFSSHGYKISVADVQLLLRMVNSFADPSAHAVSEILYDRHYLYFIVHVRVKDPTEFTGPES